MIYPPETEFGIVIFVSFVILLEPCAMDPMGKSQMRLIGLSFDVFVYYCGFMQDFRK